jgi:DNA polymerase elongation subunit (family B)
MPEIKRNRLFYDIETSFTIGWFWTAGYRKSIHPFQIIEQPRIICISYKWEHEPDVHCLDWGLKQQSDKNLLKKFIPILESASQIVGHNADSYDLKWIRQRAMIHGLKMQPRFNTIDTLKWCRSLFRLQSNKLQYVAKYLGVTEKMETGGHELWTRTILDKDPEALQKMKEYCNQDVLCLEEVFHKLNDYSSPSMNFAVLTGQHRWQCPECASVKVTIKRTYTTKQGTIKHYYKCNEQSCGKHYQINNKTRAEHLQWMMVNGRSAI